MLSNSLAAAATLTLLASPASAAYTLTKAYEGSSFFSGWSFYPGYDNTTHGSVDWATGTGALAYVDGTGNAIIKVDNTTTLASGAFRESVKITSDQTYGIGTLQVWDATHVPYGCSVWPAMWSVGAPWPNNGEIDTFEGVNALTYNAMTLHTADGCVTSANTATQTGTLAYQYCSAYDNANSGCGVTDNTNVSYGAPFAANGGGVWATQLAPTGVSVWFFPRPSVPADLQNSSMIPVPATWGTPSAFWSNTTCNIADYFGAQQLVIDITLCGDWAGNSYVFAETCSGTCTDLVANPANYNDAYFSIKSVRVYTDATLVEASTTNSTTTATSASGSAATSKAASGSTSGAAQLATGSLAVIGLIAVTLSLA